MEEKREELDDKLYKAIISEFEALRNAEPGSDEEKIITENLSKLYKLEMEKTSSELEQLNKAETEEKEAKRRRKETILKYVFEGGTLIGNFLFYGFWASRAMKYEETGSFSSDGSRNIFRSIYNSLIRRK